MAVAVASLPAAGQPVPDVSAGVQTPATSIALDTEATSLTTNPAGNAFNPGLTLEYLRSAAYRSGNPSGDGLFLSGGLGPIGIGFGEEWLHVPTCTAATPCARRTTWNLALRAGQLAIGSNVHLFSSDDQQRSIRLYLLWYGG
jgi:hypothetical protein